MVDYNNFAKTFSKSRKNMKWLEMEYFMEKLVFADTTKILDMGCGNGRFLWELINIFPNQINSNNYTWADLSSGLLEEAKKDYSDFTFHELNMLNVDSLEEKYTDIFFFASFHHLQNIEDRLEVLKKIYSKLEKAWKIYMTNWALNSELNSKRYNSAIIDWSENEYWSLDYNIKIWEFDRYYHCFSLEELEYLFREAGFKIIENKLFENNRNFISVIQK
jgi:ubiquinone/menaquinone biosynthesis C-methylase UbiE